MPLFATLAVGALAIALEERGKSFWYLASGLIATIAVLADVENIIMFALLIPALVFLLIRNRNRVQLGNTLLFVAGMAIGLVVISAVSFVLSGSYTLLFRLESSTYSSVYIVTLGPSPYIQELFPLSAFAAVWNELSLNGPLGAIITLIIPWYGNGSIEYPGFYQLGYFGLAGLVSLVYLLAKKDKNAVLLASWTLVPFLVLVFASMYNGLLDIPATPHYLTIILPPLAIAFGLSAESAVLKEYAIIKSKNQFRGQR